MEQNRFERKVRSLERLQTIYLIFSGALYGAILAVPFNYYIDPLNTNVTQTLITNFPFVIVYLVVMVPAGPLILSFAFTLKHPEKRIIPPMFIQMIGISIFITDVVLHSRDFTLTFAAIYLSLLSIMPLGAFLDQFIIFLLGRFIKAEDLKTSRLKVYSNQNTVASTIKNQARNTLHLHEKALEHSDTSIMFRTTKDVRFTTYVEIEPTKDDGTTLVNMVFLEKGDYATVDSKDLQEYQREKTVYLQRVMLDKPNEIFAQPDDGTNAELISRITDDLLGVYQRSKSLSKAEKVRLVAYLLSPIPLGIYISVVSYDATTYGAIIGTLISALTDTSRIFIKNRRTARDDE